MSSDTAGDVPDDDSEDASAMTSGPAAIGVGVLVGLLAGVGMFFGVRPDLYLALTAALTYGVGAGASTRYPVLFRGAGPAPRWSGTFGGLITFAAVFGPSPALGLDQTGRFAVGLLVIGVGFAAASLGVAMAYSAADRAEEGGPLADRTLSTPTDDRES